MVESKEKKVIKDKKRYSNEILTEKYRPKEFVEVIGNEDAISTLSNFAEEGNMPHLLLKGPAGTGKTSSALILGNKLCGSANVLEINASDERGIKIIRGIVKKWARSLPTFESLLKNIILDEGDEMTDPAQNALRRIMEDKQYKHTRFTIICNNPSKIIDPIRSRCLEINYEKIDNEKIKERIKYIADEENIEVETKDINLLVEHVHGDMRRAINMLEKYKVNKIDWKILFGETISSTQYLLKSLKGDFLNLRNKLNKITSNHEARNIMENIIEDLINHPTVSKKIKLEMKAEIIETLNEHEYRIMSGCGIFTTLMGLSSKLHLIGIKYKPKK